MTTPFRTTIVSAILLFITVLAGCSSGNTESYEDCDIKGNISYRTKEKIYHLPYQQYYDRTEIDESQGEQWFCSEEEAQDAGWRRSKL